MQSYKIDAAVLGVLRSHQTLNPTSTGLFLHPICTGGQICPLSKNSLVSDKSKIFYMLKLFFVKFLK